MIRLVSFLKFLDISDIVLVSITSGGSALYRPE